MKGNSIIHVKYLLQIKTINSKFDLYKNHYVVCALLGGAQNEIYGEK